LPRRIAFELDGVLVETAPDSPGDTENFWESLKEIEPGIVSRLARTVAERRWEIIFLTNRPPSAGATTQIQSQRWLESKGFALPSVYVAAGSRGSIAVALDLDLVVDARPQNCVDVVEHSDARTILVWRHASQSLPVEARRPEIDTVKSAGECLDMLTAAQEADFHEPGFLARVKRLLGLEKAKA
jgi:hypothetical protein